MIIALRHEEHGVHIVYSENEVKDCLANGWVRDNVLSSELSGDRPIDKSLADKYMEKFGKPPHHKMKAETIEAALAE